MVCWHAEFPAGDGLVYPTLASDPLPETFVTGEQHIFFSEEQARMLGAEENVSDEEEDDPVVVGLLSSLPRRDPMGTPESRRRLGMLWNAQSGRSTSSSVHAWLKPKTSAHPLARA